MEKDYVCGPAYKIMFEEEEEEDIYRQYKTQNYEVVRCMISADFGGCMD